jgi:hypothetical protein
LYVYRADKRRLFEHSCGYYVPLERGREDQSACRVLFKENFVKLPKAKKGEEKKERRLRVEKKDTLGSIVEREKCERRDRERDGLGSGPRPKSSW